MLYLLPNLLDPEASPQSAFPPEVFTLVPNLDGLIVENEKEGRKYLKHFTFPEGKTFREIPLALLNEQTKADILPGLLQPLLKGENWGLISDCGLPILADPGARLVHLAREHNIPVAAYPGPSSILLALMLTGLPAQQFAFHGYLPRKEAELIPLLKTLERRSSNEGSTHLFIETPYRNTQLFRILLEALSSSTRLAVAANLTGKNQSVTTLPISQWKKQPHPDLHKQPAIFLFRAG